MDQVLLLIVEDTFLISRGSDSVLILRPDFSVPPSGWQACDEQVHVLRPDGHRYPAKARFELSHFNIRDPEVPMDRRWRVTLCLREIGKEEVPCGSSILGSEELRARLSGSI